MCFLNAIVLLRRFFASAAVFFMVAVVAGGVQAGPMLVGDPDGGFSGATGFELDSTPGVTYDVSFVTGSCAELFNGCDEQSDLGGLPLAELSQALFQAFIQPAFDFSGDFLVASFDSSPWQTVGCPDNYSAAVDGIDCALFVPYQVDTAVGISFRRLANNDGDGGDSEIAGFNYGIDVDPLNSEFVYQVWTASGRPHQGGVSVAEPGTAALLMLGLGVLLARRSMS